MKKIDMFSVSEDIPKESIGNDFVMLDDISKAPLFEYPTKIDFAIMCICLKGRIEGTINLKPYSFSENSLCITFPGQIIEYSYRSEDYSGIIILMSNRFTDNLELNIKESVSAMLYLKENPIIYLSADEITYFLDYYNILRQTVRKSHYFNRLEITRLLIQALFYNVYNSQQMKRKSSVKKSKREKLFEEFYRLLLTHCKESRKVGFYAEKLCLTPKYLSAIIRDVTDKSAFDWINDYVTLEAKSLLKSTNMTIQQISDELNFASQSFFCKYFKRLTGMSPKDYRSFI
jgi:AraC-type DNA-binding domain-containing proteins